MCLGLISFIPVAGREERGRERGREGVHNGCVAGEGGNDIGKMVDGVGCNGDRELDIGWRRGEGVERNASREKGNCREY